MLSNTRYIPYKYYFEDKILAYIFRIKFNFYILHNFQDKKSIYQYYYHSLKRILKYKMYMHLINSADKIIQSKEDIQFLINIIDLHNSNINYYWYTMDNIMDKVNNFQMAFHDNSLRYNLNIQKDYLSINYIKDYTSNTYFDMQNILIHIECIHLDQNMINIHYCMINKYLIERDKFLLNRFNILMLNYILYNFFAHIYYILLSKDNNQLHIDDMFIYYHSLNIEENMSYNQNQNPNNNQFSILNIEN